MANTNENLEVSLLNPKILDTNNYRWRMEKLTCSFADKIMLLWQGCEDLRVLHAYLPHLDLWFEYRTRNMKIGQHASHSKIVCLNDWLVVVAPSRGVGGHTHSLWILDLNTMSWEEVPSPLQSIPCIWHHNDNLWFLEQSGLLNLFDSHSRQWTHLVCSGEAPNNRWGHSVTKLTSGKVVIYSGLEGDWRNCELKDDIFVLDLETLVWKKITPTGVLRAPSMYDHTADEVTENQIAIYGTNGQPFSTTRVYIARNVPPPGSIPNPGHIWILDTNSWRWENHEFNHPGRFFHTSAVVQGKLYIHGGRQIVDDFSYNIFTIYEPDPRQPQRLYNLALKASAEDGQPISLLPPKSKMRLQVSLMRHSKGQRIYRELVNLGSVASLVDV